MKIRIPFGVIFVAVILILVIAFSSCSDCQKYVPYSSDVWAETSKYREGMTSKPLSYSSYPNHRSVEGTMDAVNVANTTTSQGAGPVTSPGVRLWGFGSNLYSGTDNDAPVDMFGSTPGSTSCGFDKSFGMSKSAGPLCTTDAQYRLMTTRGGNAGSVNNGGR
jgi:hypothetical protein